MVSCLFLSMKERGQIWRVADSLRPRVEMSSTLSQLPEFHFDQKVAQCPERPHVDPDFQPLRKPSPGGTEGFHR